MDNQSEGSYTNYFPVRRIAQACNSCRQKKSRCTGDHPTCGNCRRLGIECVYPRQQSKQDSSPAKRADTATTVVDQSALESVTRRLTAIEDTLVSFGSQLEIISQKLDGSANNAKHVDRSRLTSGESPRKKLRVAPSQTGLRSGNSPNPNTATSEQVSLPREVLFAIVELFFTYCHNQPYSFFHEASFRHRLSQGTLPEHLLFAVIATALRFSRHPYFTGSLHERSVRYANQSWKLVVSNDFIVDRTADLSIVQTIALLALFDFTGQTRHGAAWVKIGMAVRIAQDLGLMLDTAHHLPYVDQEERRRVFWSVYCLDRLVSCGRGRPPAIVDASCQLLLPCDDILWREGKWQKTLTLDELLNRTIITPNHQGHFADVIAMAYVLGKSAQYMLQDLNIRSEYPPWDRGSDFAAMESDLLHLETRLEMHKSIQDILAPCIDESGNVDHQGAGHIIFSRVLFHLCHCVLNHPFLLRRRIETTRFVAPSSFLARAFDVGWQHAHCMIELVREVRSLGCIFQSSFSGYCVVVAGSIALLHTQSHKSGISSVAPTVMQEAVVFLDEIGQYWNNVWNMAQILRQAAQNTLDFEQLCSDQAQVAPLSEADTNVMWRLVDYSTMSNAAAAGLVQSKNQKDDLWLDSWIDLFGTMDNAFDFEIPMVDVSDFSTGGT